ncbi:NirD/YgiW/YdeI family stress tolerance protein [Photobacterium leiognathi]|uniref:NirD/YgiW/YdeI family stress tolerance protein n=1 Tax=Photobacterium leiognathi TaxID=553611 RepID=UPI002981F70F|nr:NirD/YgiW/YdeI family stress tolerance protein [Photobacterium leiognathi]
MFSSNNISIVGFIYRHELFATSPVILTGYIKAALGGEMYTFTDGFSDITVEIDYDKWWGLSVTPQTKVQISGEIDKEFLSTTVDVDMIKAV